jgi:hypothetical protein
MMHLRRKSLSKEMLDEIDRSIEVAEIILEYKT